MCAGRPSAYYLSLLFNCCRLIQKFKQITVTFFASFSTTFIETTLSCTLWPPMQCLCGEGEAPYYVSVLLRLMPTNVLMAS